MPKISISISDYNYWKLLGAGESASNIIQKALNDYWDTKKIKTKRKKSSVMTLYKQ
jgi:hypothetical protein